MNCSGPGGGGGGGGNISLCKTNVVTITQHIGKLKVKPIPNVPCNNSLK